MGELLDPYLNALDITSEELAKDFGQKVKRHFNALPGVASVLRDQEYTTIARKLLDWLEARNSLARSAK